MSNQFRSACIVLACMMAAGWIALMAIAASPWHPPGDGQPATFTCKAWIYELVRCEAEHLTTNRFVNLWPQWFVFDGAGQRDFAMGDVGILRFPIPGEYLIQLRPSRDPSTWVRKTYVISKLEAE